MKEKLQKLIKNKYLRFFLPLILLAALLSFEAVFDITFGDGDGIISKPVFVKFKYFFKLLCMGWFIVNVSVTSVKNKDFLLKNEKLRKLIQNNYFRFFLPIILFVIIIIVEKSFNIIVADGYGKIVIFSLWILFNLLSITFRMGRKVALFNLAFVMIILYVFNFFLRSQDPFLKGLFDSNYYFGNIIKYENSMTPPKGYDKDNFLTWGKRVIRNKYGFRDDPITRKPKGVFRVMVLGDSFTWGAGLAENEKYSSVLDSLLCDYFKGRKIEVLNCALSGSPTITERDILRELKDTVQPDLVIVGYCLNDPQPKGEDYSVEKDAFEKKWNGVLTEIQKDFTFFRLNYIGEAIKKAVYNTMVKSSNLPTWEEALGRAYDPKSKEWQDFRQALKDIKNMSDSMGCPKPIIGIFNQIATIDYHTQMSDAERKKLELRLGWLKQVYNTSVEVGFETIDYLPLMEKAVDQKKITPANSIVNPLDGHPSAILDRIYAFEFFERAKPLIESKLKSAKPE
ncbi:MAG TPA: SGNH/GDSL hydrolase family protein [Bacteroidia bacterium]|jgi:lysophospholipase L1-like esterase|nr:SGNH/GDSL hydrolase family protein [Bacteroidia bacterium]